MFILGQRSRGNQGEFPWFNFPQIGSKPTLVRWKKKLATLNGKDIYVPNELNWEWMGQVGLTEVLNPYLTKVFVQNGI